MGARIQILLVIKCSIRGHKNHESLKMWVEYYAMITLIWKKFEVVQKNCHGYYIKGRGGPLTFFGFVRLVCNSGHHLVWKSFKGPRGPLALWAGLVNDHYVVKAEVGEAELSNQSRVVTLRVFVVRWNLLALCSWLIFIICCESSLRVFVVRWLSGLAWKMIIMCWMMESELNVTLHSLRGAEVKTHEILKELESGNLHHD